MQKITLSELKELARRRGLQVEEGLLELLAEVFAARASGFDRLWSRIDERLARDREFQERYFTLETPHLTSGKLREAAQSA
ncbi:MAG: hypothetical protein RMK98_07750 [Bacteroidia bacterium]|nr:hypothetical protein [Bacteroidia bacterium]